MQVGDLVKDNHPSRMGIERLGVIVENIPHNRWGGTNNTLFKILWHNGTIGNNVWDYDLEAINESR